MDQFLTFFLILSLRRAELRKVKPQLLASTRADTEQQIWTSSFWPCIVEIYKPSLIVGRSGRTRHSPPLRMVDSKAGERLQTMIRDTSLQPDIASQILLRLLTFGICSPHEPSLPTGALVGMEGQDKNEDVVTGGHRRQNDKDTLNCVVQGAQ